jgi:DNA-binding beta-propeller fold protein YncE
MVRYHMKLWRALLAVLLVAALIGLLVQYFAPSNPIVATVEAGPLPGSIVVDEATGRVFVTNLAQNGAVLVLDGTSGAKVRTTPLGATWTFTTNGQGAEGSMAVRTTLGPSVSVNRLDARYISLDPNGTKPLDVTLPDGTLVTLNSTTGAILKRQSMQSASRPLPIGGRPAHGLARDATNTLLVEDVATREVIARVALGQDGVDYQAVKSCGEPT